MRTIAFARGKAELGLQDKEEEEDTHPYGEAEDGELYNPEL